MAVRPPGLWRNIKQSLDVYIDEQLAQGAGYLVRYSTDPGVQLEDMPVRWVEVAHADLGQIRPVRRRPNDSIGSEAEWLLTLQHFEQKDARFNGSGQASAYTLDQMVDVSRRVFEPGVTIPLTDYEGSTGLLGALPIRETPAEVPVFTADELRLDGFGLAVRLIYDADFT